MPVFGNITNNMAAVDFSNSATFGGTGPPLLEGQGKTNIYSNG